MIMSPKTYACALFLFCAVSLFSNENRLDHLSRTDPKINSLRNDISNSMYIIKSKRDPEKLPELTFYQYTLKDGDNIWNIIARTSLDMDTLLTVNRLESPSDLKTGTTIYIPNMRGIVIKVNNEMSLPSLASSYNISEASLKKVNRIQTLSKSHIFIPCGTLSTAERTAFMSGGFSAPLSPVRVTSAFGMRTDPFLNVPRFHSGVDMKCSTGTPIKASKSGVVKYAGFKKDYGNLVIISHGNGYETYYGHLHKIAVVQKQSVKRGTVIAYSGNTGRSTGPHLHFEIRKNGKPVDPFSEIKRSGK